MLHRALAWDRSPNSHPEAFRGVLVQEVMERFFQKMLEVYNILINVSGVTVRCGVPKSSLMKIQALDTRTAACLESV